MAISDAYADNGKYKAVVGKSSGDNDTEIDAQLLFVSRWLERDMGRFSFNRDTTAQIYVCDPADDALGDRDRPHVLTELFPSFSPGRALDMSAAPTLVRVDEDRDGTYETTLTTADYELLPRNALRGPEVLPYRSLRLLSSGSYTGWLPGSLVEITVRAGWPAVPEAIAQLTCQLVGIWRLDTPRATNQISQGFDAVIGTSTFAQEILQKVRRSYASGRNRVYA